MTFKIFRRGSARCIGLLSAFITILLCLYYISIGQPTVHQKSPTRTNGQMQNRSNGKSHLIRKHNVSGGGGGSSFQQKSINMLNREKQFMYTESESSAAAAAAGTNEWNDKCYVLDVRETNITSLTQFSKFDFQPEWIRTKEYWDRTFEERFEAQNSDKTRLPLKVIIVPHSHNDPGWLKTFVNYFQSDSRQILNLIVTKMQEYTDMTFIWTEISFLQLWWDQAHPTKQRALKKLIQSGRFEITTGGWVMTDEANVHLYSMLDQLIEGHQWLRNNLNVTPKVGWSIDPFGHGSTVPYLLAASNFEGAIIQRIHYAWKQWFAKQQSGDFYWTPFWKTQNDDNNEHTLLTHNMPFDIYSIKHSCGPHPFICLNFDFRKIPGEYTEYSIKAQFITDDNVEEKAQLLLEQYSRTASLYPHNVALIPIGDDFRYNKEREVDQQYVNYKKLIDHINANKKTYNVDISFGTPKDYFAEIRKRTESFPTFKGDFFVYSDIFSEGRPAYWSGYFTTRPYYKILSSDLEHNLRSSEILFSIAYNTARQYKMENAIKVFEKNYENLILARRNLALFQHHDAITGTSKSAVMRDYGLRLFESIQDVVKMQESTIEVLIQNGTSNRNFLLSELERDNYNKLPRKTPITFSNTQESKDSASFVVFNSLTHKRLEIITIRTTTPNVKILNDAGVSLTQIQINPVWNITDNYENPPGVGNQMHMERIRISTKHYEVVFLASLEPLSLTTFKIVSDSNYKRQMATVYCDKCNDVNRSSEFDVKAKPAGDIQLENNQMRLLFDEKSGFLKTITRKGSGRAMQCAIKFAAYRSAQFHSGAYLFKTDPEQNEAEKDVLEQYEDMQLIITSGPIINDVTVIYGPFLAHTMRIFNTHTHIDNGIYIENDIDFEPPPKNRETELVMRFTTDIENGLDTAPEFYSDQNGFQFHKRVKIPAIGIEGNYFPITSAAFIQDERIRLTLLTTHAQGAASYEPGQLEVMLDRRTLYDDYRGMGEGIVDSRLTRHKFWILIEEMPPQTLQNAYQVPSLLANHLSNGLRYPPNLYFVEEMEVKLPAYLKQKVILLDKSLPCDVHMINFRTLSDEQLPLFPSRSTLIILQRQGFDCNVGSQNYINTKCSQNLGSLKNIQFNKLHVEKLQSTSLTGMKINDEKLNDLSDIRLRPMEIRTFNLTFSY